MPRDLGGLAALGALGYMLSKKGNKEEGPAMDTGAFEGMKNLSRVDTGMSEREPGAGPTDYGSEKEPGWDTKPSASSMARVQNAVRNPNSGMTNAPSKYEKDTSAADAIRNKVNSGAMDTGGFETTPLDKPSSKKETYRDTSGKVQTKKSQEDRDAEMAARRENVMSSIKNFGSSIGDMASKARQNYQSTLPVSRQVQKERDQAMSRGNLKGGGKVVKMAKGGMTSSASSRGDGIAQKGKTKGTMIMCGGGYTKGKK